LDLGVPPFLVSSTLVGIMAQRLVRRICDACRVEATLTADQMGALGLRPDQMARFRGCAAGTGCVNCRGTGYFGRTGLFEMLDIRGDFAMQIAAGAGEDVLRNMARVAGVRTLRQHALERLAEGLTTVEEVVRVTGAGSSGIAGE
jgi:general secretion pathway protein E